MLITRKSDFSGNIETLDLPVTEDQLDRWYAGQHAQDAFPECTADQREFIMTGITPAEWGAMFPDEPDAAASTDGSPY